MRITTRLSTAAESGFLSMPMMEHDGDHYTLENGLLDEATVRKELSENPGIQFSGKDDRTVLSLVVEILDRMKISMKKLMANNKGVTNAVKGESKTAAERRFDKGRYAFVRIDISRKTDVLRVALSVSNPYNVVGGSEAFATIYAQCFADNITAISADLKDEDGREHLELVEGPGCDGMFTEAEKRNRMNIEYTKMMACDRYHGGFCSPCKFDCKHYKNGYCVEVED